MTETVAYLTNGAYGYPGGAKRRIPPRRLACIHITANPNTPPASALQERNYANRDGSGGPSAHTYVDRDGDAVHAIDPKLYAAWSNGVLRSPKTTTPGIPDVVKLDSTTVPGTTTTYNANEDYYREIETCGKYSAYPITMQQRESIASLIARDSVDTGIPISRATVHLHSDIDTEQRPNCPVPAAQAETFASEIIARANDIRRALVETTMTWDELLALVDERYNAAIAERDAARAERDAAIAGAATLTNELVALRAKAKALATQIRVSNDTAAAALREIDVDAAELIAL